MLWILLVSSLFFLITNKKSSPRRDSNPRLPTGCRVMGDLKSPDLTASLLGRTPLKKGEEVWIILPGLLYSETQGLDRSYWLVHTDRSISRP